MSFTLPAETKKMLNNYPGREKTEHKSYMILKLLQDQAHQMKPTIFFSLKNLEYKYIKSTRQIMPKKNTLTIESTKLIANSNIEEKNTKHGKPLTFNLFISLECGYKAIR